MAERVRIGSAELTAEIDPLGAELQSLCFGGHELMWSGDPAVWSGRAPVLFPIVGRLREDRYRLGDETYAMPKHGFARRSAFAIAEASGSAATLRLTDDAARRDAYPFAFALDMRFEVERATLTMTAAIANTGDIPLPASFGFHPAFAWPLRFGDTRGHHTIAFERSEPGTLRAITPEGLIGGHRDSPVAGNMLALDDGLFVQDALVWDTLASRRLRYGGPRGALDIAFPDTPSLGLWSKPGANYLCVEPWAGMADPQGFDGDFRAKPGIFEILPGAARHFRMIVTVSV